MGDSKVDSMIAGDIRSLKDGKVTQEDTDGTDLNIKTFHQNTDWTTQWGYYIDYTDIQEIIDAKAQWIVGKGFTADPITTMILDAIKGNGKDTFNTILENLYVDMEVGEDAYAEIIRDEDGTLINLKPLNTGRIRIYHTDAGMIDYYEQSPVKKGGIFIRIEKEDMFHLPRNRRADSRKGISMITVLVDILEAKKEGIKDYRLMMHTYVMPQLKHKMKTDDPTEIAAYKKTQDKAWADRQNIYEPFDVAEAEIISVAANATLNHVQWLQDLDARLYKAGGVPQFIVGGGTGFTEASEKIAYVAWQQKVEKGQLFFEEQILSQLGLEINLTFPATIQNELISDNAKDGPENIDESETTAGGEQ